MYEEIVKVLRYCESNRRCKECPYFDGKAPTKNCSSLLTDAEDAIDAMCEMVATAHNELANVIQSYEESKPRWIPVTERLPEPGEVVIGYNGRRRFITFARVSGVDGITHWMPLPHPPKEET